MKAVALYIGLLVFFSGLSQLMRYFSTAGERRSRWQLVTAEMDVLVGGWLLISGNFRLLVLFPLFMLAAYILTRGILLVVYYFRAKALIRSPRLYFFAAVSQVLLSGALAMMPLFAAKVFVYVMGAGLIWCGFTSVSLWREAKGRISAVLLAADGNGLPTASQILLCPGKFFRRREIVDDIIKKEILAGRFRMGGCIE